MAVLAVTGVLEEEEDDEAAVAEAVPGRSDSREEDLEAVPPIPLDALVPLTLVLERVGIPRVRDENLGSPERVLEAPTVGFASSTSALATLRGFLGSFPALGFEGSVASATCTFPAFSSPSRDLRLFPATSLDKRWSILPVISDNADISAYFFLLSTQRQKFAIFGDCPG